MAGGKTTPIDVEDGGVRVRTLRATVTQGPDAGRVVHATSESLLVGTAEDNDLVLTDRTVSRYHVELRACEDGVHISDQGSTNGTIVGAAKVDRGLIRPATVIQVGRSAILIEDGSQLKVDVHRDTALGRMHGQSQVMRRLFAEITKLADSNIPVLVSGESGTGKELVAEALHDLGPRHAKPFEVVDCGALSANLIASELFGHEKGAFTGADRQHIGAFERANGGTLFLDEIGELPVELQPNLLGALERRRFRRVGGRSDIQVNVRIVSASNRDMRHRINEGAFRLDLYYRLAVAKLKTPPLRERAEDIPLLVRKFLQDHDSEHLMETLFPPSTIAEMKRADWVGNVRALRNQVELALAMGQAPESDQRDSLTPVVPGGTASFAHLGYKEARSAAIAAFEKKFAEEIVTRAEGNVAKAAREAKMDRSYLFTLLRRHRVRAHES